MGNNGFGDNFEGGHTFANSKQEVRTPLSKLIWGTMNTKVVNGMESTIGKHNGMEKQAEKDDEELKAAFKAHKPEFAAECTRICKWIHT